MEFPIDLSSQKLCGYRCDNHDCYYSCQKFAGIIARTGWRTIDCKISRLLIKEPEELSYLFLCIALGLGMGANQVAVTVIGVGGVLFILAITRWKRRTIAHEKPNLFLEVTLKTISTC